MAAQQGPHVFECGFLAVDVICRGVVSVGSPGNVELAVGDNFVVISFLAHRGEGHKTQRAT